MSDEKEKARAQRLEWEQNELREFRKRQPESKDRYETASGIPVHRVYTPEDAVPFEKIGLPGQFPFTRGPYPTMYRGRTWTMRQIAGFGTGEDTNRRFRYLIDQGQTGLSVDFDMPTLMGYDSDDPLSEGEVGREGVAIDTLEDMRALFAGIDLEKISVSMTINPTAWILLAMYVALAQERGYDLNKLSGTVQADILKEYQAQKEWIFPIRPSMRVVRDLIVYSARNLARYNPINISGYHISEAGANAVQELAFTMCNAVAYLQEVTQAGVQVDEFAPRRAPLLGEDRPAFRREEARVDAAAVPLPARRRHSDQAAADEQRRAHRAPGALGGAGRRAVAAHQRARRGVRDPVRDGDEGGAADAADHRGRDPRGAGGRSAGRLLVCRVAHEAHRGRGVRRPRQGGDDGRHRPCRRARLFPEGDRRDRLPDGAEEGLGRAAGGGREQVRRSTETGADRDPQDRSRGRAAADRAHQGGPPQPRRRPGLRAARAARARGARPGGEPDARHHRAGEGGRDHGRDRRAPQGPFRDVRRDAGVLSRGGLRRVSP